MKETSGDVIRINITPPSDTFPWIRFFRHKSGIKRKGTDFGSIDAKIWKSRKDLALEIGEKVISVSKILKSWVEEQES